MGLSMILLFAVIGIGAVAVIIGVVVVVFISRRDDFVNPLPIKQTPPKTSREVSPSMPKNIAPHNDQESALVDWLIAEASAQTGVNLMRDQMVQDRMVHAAKMALQELETEDTAKISMPFITANPQGPKHFEITLTRRMLDQLR